MHSRATLERRGRYVAASLVLCAAVARGGQPEPTGPATTEAVADIFHVAGKRDEARAQATIALGILEHAGSASELADARGFVASLR